MDVSIWLLPQEPDYGLYSELIKDISARYHAYPFSPHITLYYIPHVDNVREIEVGVVESIGAIKPIELTLESVGYSEQFTKTLFATYSINDTLKQLYSQLYEKFYNLYHYTLNPHLSLLYKNNLAIEDSRKESKLIQLPTEIVLDTVSIIIKEGNMIQEDKDVLDWKEYRRFSLKR